MYGDKWRFLDGWADF